MTTTEYFLLALCVFLLAAFVLALLAWGRESDRLDMDNLGHVVRIGVLEAQVAHLTGEVRRLREREQCRRVFGTAPLVTEEHGDPVG